jgi:hypothetical protein
VCKRSRAAFEEPAVVVPAYAEGTGIAEQGAAAVEIPEAVCDVADEEHGATPARRNSCSAAQRRSSSAWMSPIKPSFIWRSTVYRTLRNPPLVRASNLLEGAVRPLTCERAARSSAAERPPS